MSLLRTYIQSVLTEAIDLPISKWWVYVKNRARELQKLRGKARELKDRWSQVDEESLEEADGVIRYYSDADVQDINKALSYVDFSDSYSGDEDLGYLHQILTELSSAFNSGNKEMLSVLQRSLNGHLGRMMDDYSGFSRLKRYRDYMNLRDASDWGQAVEEYGWYDEYALSGSDLAALLDATQSLIDEALALPAKIKDKIDMDNRWRSDIYKREPPSSEDVEVLYHASPEVDKLLSQGFSTESSYEDRKGLGGGSAGGVSFTHDYDIARTIMRTLRDVASIARGDLGSNQVMQWWRDDMPDKLKDTLENDAEFRAFDPQDPYWVFKLYNKYLWLNPGVRDNPVLSQTNREWFERFKNIDPKDIGIIAARVNVKHPETDYLPAEREFRVPPEAIVSVEKRVA